MIYDLEERTRQFAWDVRQFAKQVSMTLSNKEDLKQLIRSSGSVGANYIEANESLSTKDFTMRIKICRKESKESIYWLSLLDTTNNSEVIATQQKLTKECTELMKIFGAILKKQQLSSNI